MVNKILKNLTGTISSKRSDSPRGIVAPVNIICVPDAMSSVSARSDWICNIQEY